MSGGPECAATRALEDVVVDDAEERLEDEKADDHQADDGMTIVDLLDGVSDPPAHTGRDQTNRSTIRARRDKDAQTESCHRQRVGEELRGRVHPDEPREGKDPNQNRAQGEEEGKRETHDGSMRRPGPHARQFVAARTARRGSVAAGLTGPTRPTRGGGSGRARARRGPTGGGLSRKRVQGVSTLGHGEIPGEAVFAVVAIEIGQILRVAFEGVTFFDGPDPLSLTGRQIHGPAPPIRATRACSVSLVSAFGHDGGRGRRRGTHVHRTLAVILPLAIPDPSSKET